MSEGVMLGKEEMKEKRGRMLLVLCILSWVYIGIVFFFNLLAFTKGQESAEGMIERQVVLIDVYENMGIEQESIQELLLIDEKTNENFYLNYSSKIIFALIGFFAVLQMYKLQKMGYWVYIAYALVPIGIISFILGGIPSTTQTIIMELVWAGLFILLYGTQLKRMQ